MEDEKKQTSLILDSETKLVFRENISTAIVSTPLLNADSISLQAFLTAHSQHTVTLLGKVSIFTILKCLVYFRAYQRIIELCNKQIYR